VIGVESNQYSIALARKTGKDNGLEGVQFLCADVQRESGRLLREHRPELVVVNPPRVGIDRRVVEALLKMAPKDILYISCMPSTLARDLQLLCREHYELVSCQPFDMFPQTAHVETAVHLHRKSRE
jgi:23S rRNA (uracil1939-C5)-methyltransferase